MTSIFVAKLDFGVTSEQLKSTFEQFGKVLKATVATDRETGKSRGFGFIEMANEEEAHAAINALDNYTINGRNISVKLAEQKEKKPQNRDNNRGNFNRSEKPDFKSRPNNREENSSFKKDHKPVNSDYTPPTFVDPEELSKLSSKPDKTKKVKEKESKEGKKKKSGMQAYKKSGKAPRFDDFMEDEDEDYLNWKMSSRKQFDDDEDEEDTW